jgi:peptidyl-prolyl cis-trans isomerase A (cyclophilin A)
LNSSKSLFEKIGFSILTLILSLVASHSFAQPVASPAASPLASPTVEAEPAPSPTLAIAPSPSAALALRATTPSSSPSPSRHAELPPPRPREPKRIFAVIEVTYDGKPLGKIKVRFYDKFAPKTVQNFIDLAEGNRKFTLEDPEHPGHSHEYQKPFYDGLTFHRVIPDFMIQSGDPRGDGRGGPGYTIQDEFSRYVSHSKAGILGMANAGVPNSGGSQFYITIHANPELDNKHTVFGEVISGFDIVKAISKVPRRKGIDRPLKPVVIKKVTIIREP